MPQPHATKALVDEQIAANLEFWRTSPHERPGARSVENLLNKAQDAAILHEILASVEPWLPRDGRIVEMGGGQGWASCLVKRLRPDAHVTVTDVSQDAVDGRPLWERVFEVRLDDAAGAPAWALPVADRSVRLLFCFAAAHHFVDHAAVLREADRVLEEDGTMLWLYEPSAPGWLAPIVEGRANRKGMTVPEAVLVPSAIVRAGRAAGFDVAVRRWPSTRHRSPFGTVYFALLAALPPLRRLLPCTAHFVFTRAGARRAAG